MSAFKTYLRAKDQATKLATDSTIAFNAEVQALVKFTSELRLQQRRAMRLSNLLGRSAVLLEGLAGEDSYEVIDDEVTRFCEPTLNHYGFALVDHPTKRNYLTLAFKEQA